ncbi:protein PYRICULARIA ORYZAE RESISTANCE 21-like [Lolium rigidum]|uniref:protein PYRICULARIA ORYZAE RESISTANCE 21-like n=1 Tax=Lolium rigidum TaxID=89674 RepID=UPI001F5D98E7|nr:protein PYRICULARIA ORYZAE RESISTANCE 21-like [Lolium rigidum]
MHVTNQVSTLIIESNLECEKCYRKIQKVLCKLQEKEKIRTINFEAKNNTVTISGPFDPVKLSRKLRCKACEAIKDIKIVEENKPEPKKKPEPKTEEKKPEPKKEDCCKCCKPDEKKKPEPKKEDCCKCCKPDEKKLEEKKKPEEKKPEEKKKPDEKPKEDPKPAPSSTTVNLQFTQICNLCYPWPCSDPSHWGGVQYPQPQPQPQPQPPPQPQWCETPKMPALPGPGHHHPCPPWAPATPKRQPCGGPSYCGGCGSCGGGYNGWPPAMPTPLQMMQPPPMMGCGGPASSCRGCKGCRIVQEGRFIYEEYPPNSCTVM